MSDPHTTNRNLKTRQLTPIDNLKDAILQPGIYSTAVAPFIDCGGTQSDATRLLSESYVGIPSMVKAAADSAQLIGVDCQAILRDTIKQTLLENFDPERVDAALITAEVRGVFLSVRMWHY